MKAAPVIRALKAADAEQMLIHTGSHGEQTAAVIAGVERELMARHPALLVVYGDVNSTLGAALAAAKLGVPVAHVEAGLRSFDDTMPEEINRRLTDQLCELLFVTSPEAIGYLGREGIASGGMHFVGNTMIDTLVACLDRLDAAAARTAHGLPERYLVATLHRPFNVDSPEAAALLVKAMHQVADEAPVIMPVHPRGRPHSRPPGWRRTRGSGCASRWATWSSCPWCAARRRRSLTRPGCRKRRRSCGCRA